MEIFYTIIAVILYIALVAAISAIICGLYLLFRCRLADEVNNRMFEICINTNDKGEWYQKWSVYDFIFKHPFTFRINKYIEKVRASK